MSNSSDNINVDLTKYMTIEQIENLKLYIAVNEATQEIAELNQEIDNKDQKIKEQGKEIKNGKAKVKRLTSKTEKLEETNKSQAKALVDAGSKNKELVAENNAKASEIERLKALLAANGIKSE